VNIYLEWAITITACLFAFLVSLGLLAVIGLIFAGVTAGIMNIFNDVSKKKNRVKS